MSAEHPAAQDRLRRYEQPTAEELDREERGTADLRHGIESAAYTSAPPGLRWANGGGLSHIGECNGWHLARISVSGTLCGRYGPATPKHGPQKGEHICGSCARIAKVPRVAE